MPWLTLDVPYADIFRAPTAAIEGRAVGSNQPSFPAGFLPCLGCKELTHLLPDHYKLCLTVGCPWTICANCSTHIASLADGPDDPTEKLCKKCQLVKPIDQFNHAPTRSNPVGRTTYCGECERKRVREYTARKRKAKPQPGPKRKH